jgi:thioredoxin 1
MASESVLEITDGNFDQVVLKSEQPILIDFWAAWCGPCKALGPIVDEVAAAYQGKVRVGKMDVDKSPITPQRYGVRGIPTLLIFKNGQVQEQIVGYVGRDVIEKALNKQVNVVEMPKTASVEKTNVR